MRLFHLFPRKKSESASIDWEPPTTKPYIYVDEDGRRHRGDAPYILPKDEQEIRRLDYQHFILRQVLKGNTFAPVDLLLRKPANILDVGCGTGRWGCEIAVAYPNAQVIGLDLEDIPHTVSTPLNYQFYRGNLLNGLPFAAQQFHYVHQRLLVAAIPLDKWPWVLGELWRVTCLEGWVELIEMGNAFHQAGPATKQFLAWWVAICAIKGIDASKMSQLGSLLKQSGFAHVQTKTEMLAVGNWGGRVGNLLAQDLLAGWPSMRPLAHALLQVSPEQFDAVIGQLEAEWNTYHTTYEVYCACGQV